MKQGSPSLSRRKFLRLAGVAGGALLVGNVLAACASLAGTQPRARTIGLAVLGANGSLDQRLQMQTNAVQLALDEINAGGGAAGMRLQLSRRERMAAIVLGAAAAPENGLLIEAFPESLGSCSPRVFSMGLLAGQRFGPLVEWLTKNVGRSVFLVGSEGAWTRAAADTIKKSLESAGGRLVATHFMPRGDSTAQVLLEEVRQANPDVLWSLLAGEDALAFAGELAQVSLRQPVVASGWDELSAASRPNLLAGAITVQPWFASLDSPQSRRFFDAYKGRFGSAAVSWDGVAAYEGVHLYAAAVRKAGTTAIASVLAALPQVEIEGPQGQVRFDAATRVLLTSSYVGEVTGRGGIDVHEKLPSATPMVAGCE